ncbi:hypothetical protein M406DRAFT_64320 [Cryphonectria parasitica EP155]|uniref:Glucose-methanol-choline oxidoreductase N-terminal domain-containing protein n=1 Tax=Cryphonectria parasitica (strain ATCC 38755 / EP155) TaxID=660469 RepID=A0A9P4XYE8_CRYP1|nr:uncharacterized protein M406DRAFT_64320 [Cryphonectria parasitica EP155]KAF3763193.1 hypothetical protein M406DRAFT_64320 [Cryphonectria parasitica EP155]
MASLNATVYDYVVVGSGPGGGPTAANLAVAGYKVLLIDAGGDEGDNLFETVPVLFPRATDDFPATQWNYFVTRSSDPVTQAKDAITSYLLSNGSLYTGLDPPENATAIGTLYPRAGTLGGCSRHNALITIRAFDSDWEAVADLTGDTSWNGSTFERLFEEIEHCNYLPNSVVGHGFAGWLWTELTSLVTAVQDLKVVSIIVSAASAMGESLTGILVETVAGLAEILAKDINAPGPTITTGPYQIPLSMKDSTRNGARDWILQVANAVDDNGARTYHLDIKLNTLVTKINFDNSTGDLRATGVEYLEGQSLYRADPRWQDATVEGSGVVNVAREVIIAAGAFNTPQILKLSGIGPADELAEFGIEQLVDLPVGNNLRDHIEVSVISESTSNFTLEDGCTFMYGYPEVPDPCLERYLQGVDATAKGVYATSGEAVGVVIKSSAASGDDADIMVYGAPAGFPGFFPGWAKHALDSDHMRWTWISLKASTQNTAGTVKLRSSDPRDVPVIAFNTFDGSSDAAVQDLQASYEGIAFARRAMDDLIPLDGSFTETQPGRANVSTEDEIKEYVSTNSFGHHACCTAPIGTVLDSRFGVKGTQGLRVVDASAFPVIPGFFIQLPTYLLSSKASEAILEDASKLSS